MSESYIVHVYRREDDGTLVGMVEEVGDSRRRPFKSCGELWAILKKHRPKGFERSEQGEPEEPR